MTGNKIQIYINTHLTDLYGAIFSVYALMTLPDSHDLPSILVSIIHPLTPFGGDEEQAVDELMTEIKKMFPFHRCVEIDRKSARLRDEEDWVLDDYRITDFRVYHDSEEDVLKMVKVSQL